MQEQVHRPPQVKTTWNTCDETPKKKSKHAEATDMPPKNQGIMARGHKRHMQGTSTAKCKRKFTDPNMSCQPEVHVMKPKNENKPSVNSWNATLHNKQSQCEDTQAAKRRTCKKTKAKLQRRQCRSVTKESHEKRKVLQGLGSTLCVLDRPHPP